MASLTAYVKGDPVNSVLGDCPFCHRVLITLEQKNVQYEKQYIDFANKPSWLQEKSGGKVPVMNRGDFWLPDSDAIVVWLEEQFPEPSMVSSVPPEVGQKLFGAFRGFLKSKPEDEKASEEALLAELKLLDDYLSQNGPLFGGTSLNATDAAVAPKLHHAEVALKHFKGWEIPSELKAVNTYLEALKAQPAWQKSLYNDALVIKGWTPHYEEVAALYAQ